MEFYKLFHKRTNYHSLLEWIDRGFRPEIYEQRDEMFKERVSELFLPLIFATGLVTSCLE